MPDTTCHMSMSLDGFVAGPDQSREDPPGQAGAGAARLAYRRPESQRCRQGRERVAHAPAGRVRYGPEHVRPDPRGLG